MGIISSESSEQADLRSLPGITGMYWLYDNSWCALPQSAFRAAVLACGRPFDSQYGACREAVPVAQLGKLGKGQVDLYRQGCPALEIAF
jgi:hypothetical protein